MRVKFGFHDIAGGHQKQAGESPFDSATITRWHKKVGDAVKVGEPIFYFEADKIDTDFESPMSGTIVEIREKYSKDGSSWQVGVDTEILPDGKTLLLPHLGVIETEDTESEIIIPDKQEEEPSEVNFDLKNRFSPVAWNMVISNQLDPEELIVLHSTTRKITKEMVMAFMRKGEPETNEDAVIAVPAARHLAREVGVDISDITGTGDDGLILVQDVEQYIAQIKEELAKKEEFEDRVPLSASLLRKTVARLLARSWREIPHAGDTIEINVTKLWEFRKRHKEGFMFGSGGAKLRLDHFFMFFAARLLVLNEFKILNSYWDEDDEEAYLFKNINLGVSVQTPRGLMVPIVHKAETLSFKELILSAERKINMALEGNITIPDLRDLTFTINNPGVAGGEYPDPIIPYTIEQSGKERPTGMIVALGRVRGTPLTGQYMNVAVRFDHRLLDGVPVLEFVQKIKEYVESKSNPEGFWELANPDFRFR